MTHYALRRAATILASYGLVTTRYTRSTLFGLSRRTIQPVQITSSFQSQVRHITNDQHKPIETATTIKEDDLDTDIEYGIDKNFIPSFLGRLKERERALLLTLPLVDDNLESIRKIPTRVHNAYLIELKQKNRLDKLLQYYQNMKVASQLSVYQPPKGTTVSAAPHIGHHPSYQPPFSSIGQTNPSSVRMRTRQYPLCDLLTYNVVIDAIVTARDETQPTAKLLEQVYWDMMRDGWRPTTFTIQRMLQGLAEREIKVQRRLEEIERFRLVNKVCEETQMEALQEEWAMLMSERNLEQAMTLFNAAPVHLRMSLSVGLVNLLMSAAAERGDPRAALTVFEWLDTQIRHFRPVLRPTFQTDRDPYSIDKEKDEKEEQEAEQRNLEVHQEIERILDHKDAPHSKEALAVRLAARPPSMTHPSKVMIHTLREMMQPSERRRKQISLPRILPTPNHNSYAELAGAFARAGDIASALDCIRAVKAARGYLKIRQPDLVHRRVAEMLARRGDLNAAAWVVNERMRIDGVAPSPECLATVTQAICAWGRVNYASQFLKRVRRHLPGQTQVLDGDGATASVLSPEQQQQEEEEKAWGSTSTEPQTDETEASFLEKCERNFDRAYNVLLEQACLQSHDLSNVQLARRIFDRHRNASTRFSWPALRAYVRIATQYGDVGAVYRILGEMRRNGYLPDPDTADNIAAFLARGGRHALADLSQDPSKDVDPMEAHREEIEAQLPYGETWRPTWRPKDMYNRLAQIAIRFLQLMIPDDMMYAAYRRRLRFRTIKRLDATLSTYDPISKVHLSMVQKCALAAIHGVGFAFSTHTHDTSESTPLLSLPRERATAAVSILLEFHQYLHMYNVLLGPQLAAAIIEALIEDAVTSTTSVSDTSMNASSEASSEAPLFTLERTHIDYMLSLETGLFSNLWGTSQDKEMAWGTVLPAQKRVELTLRLISILPPNMQKRVGQSEVLRRIHDQLYLSTSRLSSEKSDKLIDEVIAVQEAWNDGLNKLGMHLVPVPSENTPTESPSTDEPLTDDDK